MKIAVIRSECSFRKGGAERYAANLCRALARAGHQVWVVAETFDPAIHPDLIHVPVAVDHSTSAARTNSFQENSCRAVSALTVDAILALSRAYPSDAFRVSDPLHRFWMEIRYTPVRRFFEKFNPRHRAILALENAILDPANTRMIITNSHLSKSIIRDYYDYPPERIHVAYNGVDLEKFSPTSEAAAEPGAVRLLFVGQDFRRKGLAEVIGALALLKDSRCPPVLRVIGRDRPNPYRALARKLGVESLVTFEGPTGEIENAYRAADLLVFPTHYDPFANVCLEALACGLPVLTTTTNGASEVIAEGIDGYVVSGRPLPHAESIAAKIAVFLRLSAEERRLMRGAAREKAAAYTVEANAARVAELLFRGNPPS